MMRIALVALSLLLTSTFVYGKGYGKYDLNRIRTIESTASGKKYSFDEKYLDPMLRDLGSHAENYPARFDTAEDRGRAIQDVIGVSGIFDALLSVKKPGADLLIRVGYLHTLGRNLGIPGSAEKADASFKKLLKAKPTDPQGNFMYGVFLAGENKVKKAIPYLDKAFTAGMPEAAYTLGMAHYSLGNKKKALDYFEKLKKRSPYYDESANKMIAEINKDPAKSTKPEAKPKVTSKVKPTIQDKPQ